MVEKGAHKLKKRRPAEGDHEGSPEQLVDSSELDSMSIASSLIKDEESKPNTGGINAVTKLDSDGLSSEMSGSEDENTTDKLVKIQNQYVLGMLSRNRELFLFDRQVKIGKRIETWLQAVEDSMRVSVKKHLKNAILRFSS